MSTLNINDFELGGKVHHSTNTSITMSVIEINKDRTEITCRWIDKKGNSQKENFIPQELIKELPSDTGIFLG